MISVSSISEFMYCPMKLFLKHNNGDSIETEDMVAGKIIQDVRRGFDEITKRNIWQIKEKLELDELFDAMYYDVPQFIEETVNKYYKKIDSNTLEDISKDLNVDLTLQSRLIAFKVMKILEFTGKRGSEISEMLFPQSLLQFQFQNEELNLRGIINKIEIVNRIYYPVLVSTGIPPSNGVWHADALQIAAYGVLMDYELNKEVLVGFIEYTKIGERRPVVINSILHNKLFNVMDSINRMLKKQELPEFKVFKNKCEKCEYVEICEYCS